MKRDRPVTLEYAKLLKEKGFSKPTHFYWLDKDLPFCERGLKSCKNDDKLNHNKYDDFIYSAPTYYEAFDWLMGNAMHYKSTLIIKMRKNEN